MDFRAATLPDGLAQLGQMSSPVTGLSTLFSLTAVHDELHVWALVARENELYVAGNFASIGDVPSYGVGIWHEGIPPAVRANLRAGRLVLSCPREFQSAAIESANSLALPVWIMGPNVNWTVSKANPNEVEAELTASGSQAFCRLRWPE